MLQPRTAPADTAARLALLAAIVLTLAACGRAVTVDSASMDASTRSACQQLHDRLPTQFANERRVAIAGEDGTTAAWGGPPIVWRCGVPRPAALTRTSQLITVNRVDWLPEQLSDGVRFTSVGSRPAVEVTFPSSYPVPASLLAALPTG